MNCPSFASLMVNSPRSVYEIIDTLISLRPGLEIGLAWFNLILKCPFYPPFDAILDSSRSNLAYWGWSLNFVLSRLCEKK